MDFIDIYRRILNMLQYEVTLAEAHELLVGQEGVSEEDFYFAWKSALGAASGWLA